MTKTLHYTYAQEVRGSKSVKPQSNPAAHGAKLRDDLKRVAASASALSLERIGAGLPGDRGIVVEFESQPGFELALKSLDRVRDGIELLSVRERDPVILATVLVPDGKLTVFEKLIEVYSSEVQLGAKRKNVSLVANIAGIRLSVLESLWTDEGQLPGLGEDLWWEVWLRNTQASMTLFRDLAGSQGMRVGSGHLEFVDRYVVLAYGTAEQIGASSRLLDVIAELRRAKDLASFFDAMPFHEQRQWVDSLAATAVGPSNGAPAVCLLDTGVKQGHPLISPFLSASDMHAVDSRWGVGDHGPHGTEMAGLALWGDLAPALAGDNSDVPQHLLESVVLLPPLGASANPPDLYGKVTAAAVALPEIVQPFRRRVFCLTVTTSDGRDRGRPSSWSAEVDVLCCGRRDGVPPRLVVVAAGNVSQQVWSNYPDVNDSDQVHDPGQAWNALTVGAITHKAWFDPAEFPGWRPIAKHGALSASSTTSVPWVNRWPNKPDVVFEGGNAALSPSGEVATPAAVRLLSTSGRQYGPMLDATGDTSGATALAARLAVRLMVRYPEFWPETIRGLTVHSARWSDSMRATIPAKCTKQVGLNLMLRRYGWGEPDFGRASASADNFLTLIAERTIQPFEDCAEPGRAPNVKTKDWHLFDLPWPRDALLSLGDAKVELRVTLSYFIEPNPGRRGQVDRYAYQSYGLRFAMQNATESLTGFRSRVSKVEQDAEVGHDSFSEPGWLLGRLRNRGAISSDVWSGTAADLAERRHLAVHPVGGWWRFHRSEQRWNETVRYALVVSILAADTEVDIYTPVAVQVGVEIEV